MFVAGFIGSPQMNLFECRVKKKDEKYHLIFDYYDIILPKRMNDYLSMYENKEVFLGIRPEDLSIASENDDINTFEIFVDIAEMTGADHYLYGTLNNKRIIANIASGNDVQSDKKYKFKIDIDRIHIFDKINERLICD